MPINYQKLINWSIPEVEQHLTRRDTLCHALGVGLGSDTSDADQLKFVYEENLQALPTLEQLLELENVAVSSARLTHDHPEGIAAFKEKRKPIYKGR